MKTTNSKKIKEKVNEIVKLRAKIRELKAVVDQASADVKEFIGKPGAVKAGNYLAVLTEQERRTLDRKGLLEEFGPEAIEPFEKITTVRSLNIKPL